jgi:hypothetical protein
MPKAKEGLVLLTTNKLTMNNKRTTTPRRLDRFFESTADSFAHPEILAWAAELRGARAARIAQSEGQEGAL